jgi:hypothetical protein
LRKEEGPVLAGNFRQVQETQDRRLEDKGDADGHAVGPLFPSHSPVK